MGLQKTLGVEINDHSVRFGYRSGKRLCAFTQVDTPVEDGCILDTQAFENEIRAYCGTHQCGKAVMLTVNSKRIITRRIKIAAAERRSLFPRRLAPDFSDSFPVALDAYAVDFRQLDSTTVLACGIPKEMSLAIAGMFRGTGLIPLRLDAYVNSVGLALERLGADAVCVLRDMIVCVTGGVLRDIVFAAGEPELRAVLDGMDCSGGACAYNPAGFVWADELFSRAGAQILCGDELGLMGLLEAR